MKPHRSGIRRIVSGMRTKIMGHSRARSEGDLHAATIIPSVGAPWGAISVRRPPFLAAKGKFVNFFETGDQFSKSCAGWKSELKVRSFFVMDENFLLHRERAMRLLELMKAGGKSGPSRSSPRQTRSVNTRCRSWWSWASHGFGWDWSPRWCQLQ